MEDTYNTTVIYLKELCGYLSKGRAALLVGSGFSRNAIKFDDSVPDVPLWDDITKAFIEKLAPSVEEFKSNQKANPLDLAEKIEVLFGRPELDNLLIEKIRDRDYIPSDLHRNLLTLPWTDVFTTNYDTLLERANETIAEYPLSPYQETQNRTYRVVLTKNDLVGSAGTHRIVKLHGSFPSTRPFIITAEDYRTYPQKFAPFVNTVQQSLLENTLCLIGFSGDDPNFKNWIGWIRDNLGKNTPKIYLLLHKAISSVDRKMLEHQNIVPVDLSLVFGNVSPTVIYSGFLKYLREHLRSERPGDWNLKCSINCNLSLSEAKQVLQIVREAYPGYASVPYDKLDILRNKIFIPARMVLLQLLKKIESDPKNYTDEEILFLYEYNWFREKALIPLFDGDPNRYKIILDRHKNSHPHETFSILLSLLRDCRINGEWKNWNSIAKAIQKLGDDQNVDLEQMHELHWENCLHSMATYDFKRLSQHLTSWSVSPEMHQWILRKANLLAENGEPEKALELLNAGIMDVRKRLSRCHDTSFRLLSFESAMMELQYRVKTSLNGKNMQKQINGTNNSADMSIETSLAQLTYRRINGNMDNESTSKDSNVTSETQSDFNRRAIHSQHNVSWPEQNQKYSDKLNSPHKPFYKINNAKSNRPFIDDNFVDLSYNEYCLSAYSFLRFREETGVPFFICNVYFDRDYACKAAEMLSQFYSEYSVLAVVRADYQKAIQSILSRGKLSAWPTEDVDAVCQIYINALLQSESLLELNELIVRNRFVRQAADVLPVALAELCHKCSRKMYDHLLDLLEKLYHSGKKACYQEMPSLIKSLMLSYPVEDRKQLILRLIRFPAIDKDKIEVLYYPDPISYVPNDKATFSTEQSPIPEIEDMLKMCDRNNSDCTNKLMYCFEHGLLTEQQVIGFGTLLWKDGTFHAPPGWLRNICFRFPAPEHIDLIIYLADAIVKDVNGYAGKGTRTNNDFNLLNELNAVALSRLDAFSPQQVSIMLNVFSARIESLINDSILHSPAFGSDSLTKSLIFSTLHSLWLVSSCRSSWTPSESDSEKMRHIIEVSRKTSYLHFGIQHIWGDLLRENPGLFNRLDYFLCNPDTSISEWGYRVLAIAIRHLNYHMLSESEIQFGLYSVAQQIQWRAQPQLSLALQVADVIAVYQPQLFSSSLLDNVMTGIGFLAQETKISQDDTNEIVTSKIELRKLSARFIKNIQNHLPSGKFEDTIKLWTEITLDHQEFAEVRNA